MTKKLALCAAIPAVLTASLYANFITDQVNKNIQVSGSFGATSNPLGALSNINAGSIEGIVGDYAKNYGLKIGKQALGGVGSSIYSNTGLGAWWENNSEWSTGITEMCYEFDPNIPQETFPDICSLVGNMTVDPCKFLPDQLGPYKKIPYSNQWKKQLPLRDWCRSFSDKVAEKNKTLEEAIEENTITGKEKEDIADSHFGSEKEREEREATEQTAAAISKGETASDRAGSLQKTLKDFDNEGKGHLTKDAVEIIAKNTQGVTGEEKLTLTTLPYKSLKEYNDDTHFHAQSNYALEEMLFFPAHLDTAEAKFEAINTQYLGSVANPTPTHYSLAEENKKTFIETYIEDENKGYRNMAYEWAAHRAQEEIKYEMPDKLEQTYYAFDTEAKSQTRNSSNFENEQEIKKNLEKIYNIKKQQYAESQIMQKWRRKADAKADKLKRLFKKAAIASQPFNIHAAQQEIMTIIGAGQ